MESCVVDFLLVVVLGYLVLMLLNSIFDADNCFIPLAFLWEPLKKINEYFNKNNLKQMNLKILGKAMGFMFLPTLGVLLLLVVGFFDPVAMWHWIKSNEGWAIFARIFIFILETGLVTLLYFNYLKDHVREQSLEGKDIKQGKAKTVSPYTEAKNLFGNGSSDDKYYLYKTESPDIIVIELKKNM